MLFSDHLARFVVNDEVKAAELAADVCEKLFYQDVSNLKVASAIELFRLF